MLKKTSAIRASTIPTLVRPSSRSRSKKVAMITVIPGDKATIGKIRYAGPMVSALNSTSGPPAPVNPISNP